MQVKNIDNIVLKSGKENILIEPRTELQCFQKLNSLIFSSVSADGQVQAKQTNRYHIFPSCNFIFYIQYFKCLLVTARLRSACSVWKLCPPFNHTIKMSAHHRHICTSQYTVQVEAKSMPKKQLNNKASTCERIKMWSTAGP